MIPVRGREPVGRHRGATDPASLQPLRRHPEPFVTPEPLHPLAIDREAFALQHCPRAANPNRGSVVEISRGRRPDRLVGVAAARLMSLCRAMLSYSPTRAPLRERESLLDAHHGFTPACRAHKFPRAASRRLSRSSAWSATIRFNR